MQLKKRLEKVKLIEQALSKHHENISKKVNQLSVKERVITQRELAWLKHREEMQKYIELYEQKKRLLDDEIKSKLLLLENIEEKWSEQIIHLAGLKVEINRDIHHIKKFVDADMHALYEKEADLKAEAENLRMQKEDFTKQMNQLDVWKQHSIVIRKREHALIGVEKQLEKTKENITAEYERLAQEKELSKYESVSAKIPVPKQVKYKLHTKKPKADESSILSLIYTTKLLVERHQLKEAKAHVAQIVQLLKKLKSNKKHVFDYELRDIKTSIKLANL